MAELKTKVGDADVLAYIDGAAAADPKKREDSLELLDMMRRLSGCEARLWGSSIIGFGSYHYKSERSRQEGDWPLIGFSPRKAAFSLYVYTGLEEHAPLLEGLGKFTMGKACIYAKRLSDLNRPALERLITETLGYMRSHYPAGAVS